jgi:hypothetical protein
MKTKAISNDTILDPPWLALNNTFKSAAYGNFQLEKYFRSGPED